MNQGKPCCKTATASYMGRIDKHERKTFMEELSKFDPATAENLQNMFAQELKAAQQAGIQIGERKGMQIGKREGMQIGERKGMQIGKQEGMQKTLETLVKAGLLTEAQAKEVIRDVKI